MMTDTPAPTTAASEFAGEYEAKNLSPAALRALQEAEERRARYVEGEVDLPKELGGRKGLEPTRYGDWEVKGLTSDF